MNKGLIILAAFILFAGCDTDPRYLGVLDPENNVLQYDDLLWQPPSEPKEPSIPISKPSASTPTEPPDGSNIFEYLFYQLSGYNIAWINGQWDYKKDEEFTINGKTIRYVDIYYDELGKNVLFSTASTHNPYNTQLILRPTGLAAGQSLTKAKIDSCIQVETRIDYWGKYPFTQTYKYWYYMFENLSDRELVFEAYALDEKTDGSEGGVEPEPSTKVYYTIHLQPDSCSRLYVKCYKK